jgi:hypothetical protein
MSDRATAAIPTPKTQNVDTTQILLDELQKLGDPLPIPVLKMHPSGLYTLTIRRLQEQGKESYTEGEFRSALRQVIRELTDTSRDNLTAAEERHTSAIERNIIAAMAEAVLEKQGKSDDYTRGVHKLGRTLEWRNLQRDRICAPHGLHKGSIGTSSSPNFAWWRAI